MNDSNAPCSPAQLKRYLRRISIGQVHLADAATLRALHAAHLEAIAFENLEIHFGRPMRIEPEALFADLVDRRRGGYCFQMNELFARVLLRLGYRIERFAARVLTRNPADLPPRSHQVLRVTDQSGERWLCDVGFGGGSPLYPLPWQPGHTAEQPLASYRLLEDAQRGIVVQIQEAGNENFEDMLSLTTAVQWPVDFKYSNYAISTMPGSRFVEHRIASRISREDPDHGGQAVRHTFLDGCYRARTSSGIAVEQQLDDQEQVRVLREVFLLDLPDPVRWSAT